MLSALLMLRRVGAAFRYAVREEEFLNIFGAQRRLGLAFVEVRAEEKRAGS
jgi:hypothetical protein